MLLIITINITSIEDKILSKDYNADKGEEKQVSNFRTDSGVLKNLLHRS